MKQEKSALIAKNTFWKSRVKKGLCLFAKTGTAVTGGDFLKLPMQDAPTAIKNWSSGVKGKEGFLYASVVTEKSCQRSTKEKKMKRNQLQTKKQPDI